jgi:hypothetical protein
MQHEGSRGRLSRRPSIRALAAAGCGLAADERVAEHRVLTD